MPSSTMPLDLEEPIDLPAIAALSGAAVITARRVSGGRNARVWQVETPGGRLAVKQYPPPGSDGRDRFAAESAAIAFLHHNAVQGVPELLAACATRRLAIFRWVEGVPAMPAEGAEDMDQAVEFARTLHGLRHATESASLPLASEACLSGEELVGQIERRLMKLQEVVDGGVAFDRLVGDVVPARLATAAAAMRRTWAADGIDPALPLPRERCSLSPSDFGLHNALRRPDGSLVFLDFEYFGWDDPVKLVTDFLLHPGMGLASALGRRFLDGARAVYAADDRFEERLRSLAELYVLRWTLILLNEFLPERMALRRANGLAGEPSAIRAVQQQKAQRMLSHPLPKELPSW
jgi:hypothetical protein